MAIDPSISLGYRPPQFQMPQIQTPLERFAKVLSLQNLMRQGQLGDIQLQTGRLNLEQLQQGLQEKKEFADYIRNEIAKSQQPQPAAPAALPTPALPLIQPTPVGGTVAQTESPTIAPLQTAPAVTSAPAGPVTIAPDFGLPTKPVPTPATAPQAGGLGVQPVPGLAGLGPSFNYAEIATRFPLHGTQFIEQHSKAIDTILKTEDAKAKIIQDNDNRLSSLAQGIVDETTKNSAIATALYEKRITPAQRDYLQAKPWNDPIFGSFIQHALKSNEYFTKKREDIASQIAQNEEKRKQALAPYQERKAKAEAGAAELTQEGQQTAQDARTLSNAAIVDANAQKQGIESHAVENAKAAMGADRASKFEGAATPMEFLQRGTTAQEQITAAETKRQHGIQNVIAAQREHREGQIFEQTYGAGSNPALAAVEPRLRVSATRDAQKAGNEYLTAMESADQFHSMLNLARAGNKAAGSNLPLLGVETLNAINGIKRINRDEIKQWQGAGNLYDKIVGEIGGLTVGKPIPEGVLKDVETMYNLLRDNAERSYKTKLDGINQNYHSDFQPVKGPSRGGIPQNVADALKAAGPGDHRGADGKWWHVDPDGSMREIAAPAK